MAFKVHIDFRVVFIRLFLGAISGGLLVGLQGCRPHEPGPKAYEGYQKGEELPGGDCIGVGVRV